jgi:hypothetical protein
VIPTGDSGWLLEAARPVWALRDLPEDWDTYGSPPVSAQAIEIAIKVLCLIAAGEPPMPYAVPLSGGGVQLEWRRRDRQVEIEATPDGRIHAYATDSGRVAYEGFIAPDDAKSLVRLVAWLAHG